MMLHFINRKVLFAYLMLSAFLVSCAQPMFMDMERGQEIRPTELKEIPPPSEPSLFVGALPKSTHMPMIVIDPGHGGKDLGAHSFKIPKYQEKNLNLTTAHWVKHYLQKMGYATHMTRKDDVFIPLSDRASFANDLSSHLFVSIHYNSAPNASAEGIEVFYYPSEEDKKRTKKSKKLAQTVLSNVINSTQAKSRGVKTKSLAVIRETTMPAVLVEGGFLTNPKERRRIQDKNYIRKLALGIAKGIDDYVKHEPSKMVARKSP